MIICIQSICRKEKTRQDGMTLVYIRFTQNRSRRYVSTGIYIRSSEWDSDRQCFTEKTPENEEARLKIESIKYKYIKRLKQLEALDKEISIQALLDEKRIKISGYTLKECLEQAIERLEALGKYTSASKHKTALSLFMQFKPTPTRLEEIDFQLLEEFELFLIRRGNRNNSIATKFSLLKAAYNKAIEEGKFTPKSNPFRQFKVGKLWTATAKRAIGKEGIQRIEHYTPSKKAPYLSFARDIFFSVTIQQESISATSHG